MVSLIAHALLLTTFLVVTDADMAEPEQEQAVSVELVPPPDEKPADEKKPEQAQAEQLKAASQAPEQAPSEESAGNAAPPPPPETPPAEKPPEPPPPAPEPAEPPPEQPESPQQQSADNSQEQPQPDEAAGDEQPSPDRVPLPVLRPAVQFADKDAGPEKSLDGGSDTKDGQPDDPAMDETSPENATAPSEDQGDKADDAGGPSLPADINLPGVKLDGTAPAAAEADGAATAGEPPPSTETVEAKKPGDTPSETADASNAAKSAGAKLKSVRKLFSTSADGADEATTDMADMPRGARVNRLCLTELREQLRHGAPRFEPELLPSYPADKLDEGTEFIIRGAAFRAGGRWYDLDFRCEVDEGGTRVQSFGYEVGDPVPRNDWHKRGFPAF